MYTERNEVRMRVAIVTGASSGMGDRKEKRKFRESGRAVPSAFAYL